MAEHPDTNIRVEPLTGDDYFANGPRLLASDDAPDVTATQTGFPNTWDPLIAEDLLLDISDVWDEQDLENQYLSAVVANYTEDDGSHRAVQAGLVWWPMMFYNMDLFAELEIEVPDDGLVASVDEWFVITDALVAAGLRPIAVPHVELQPLLAVAQSYMTNICGVEWQTEIEAAWRPEAPAVDAKYTDQCAVDALQLIVDWNERGIFGEATASLDRNLSETLFFTEEAGMWWSGNWEAGAIAAAELPFEVGWIQPPPVTDNPFQAELFSHDGLAITANTDNPELAKDFLSFVSTAPSNVSFWEQGRIPGRKDAAPDPATVDALALSMFTSLEDIVGPARPGANVGGDLESILIDGIGGLLVGTTTPEEVAAQLQTEFDRLHQG
jgi:ABC-type glycerol-3-phosphate transport system substrate-binding protein